MVAHHQTGKVDGGGPCALELVKPAGGGGDVAAAVGDAIQGHVKFLCLARQRAGVVDDDAIRMRGAAGSARPDAILEQSSRYCSPDLLDKVQPASRWCMGSARASCSGRSPMPGQIVWSDELQPQLLRIFFLQACEHVTRAFERGRAGLKCRNIGL